MPPYLPQSDACFVKAYPRETNEAFLDGHVSGFAFFGGVTLSILYDNTRQPAAFGKAESGMRSGLTVQVSGRNRRSPTFTGIS